MRGNECYLQSNSSTAGVALCASTPARFDHTQDCVHLIQFSDTGSCSLSPPTDRSQDTRTTETLSFLSPNLSPMASLKHLEAFLYLIDWRRIISLQGATLCISAVECFSPVTCADLKRVRGINLNIGYY